MTRLKTAARETTSLGQEATVLFSSRFFVLTLNVSVCHLPEYAAI